MAGAGVVVSMCSVETMVVVRRQMFQPLARQSVSTPALELSGIGTAVLGINNMKTIFLAFLLSVGIASAATFNNSFTTNSESPARRVVTNIVTTILSNSPSLVNPTSYGTTTTSDLIVDSALFLQSATLNIDNLVDGILYLSSGTAGIRTVGEGLADDGTQITVSKTLTTVNAGTNNAAVTNLFFGVTNKMTYVSLTNNATSTNFAGAAAGEFHNATVIYDPQLVNRTNVYPVGNQYGQRWVTNVNAPLFTTLTNGSFYILSLTTAGTNVFASMSAWSKN